jgi:imidazole glycerol-phosphate synthase subunit HisF
MLRPRIIPCLLLRDNGLVKTQRFKDEKYVGDPINAIRIFNEKKCDELMVLDIDASAKNRDINLSKVQKFAAECRMPLCYGGGIKSVAQAKSIISMGVEKVAISSGAIEIPTLVKDLAGEIGSQSVVVVLDVKKNILGRYIVFTHNGTKSTGSDLMDIVKVMQERGAGEIVVNSINNDGMLSGYDLKLAKRLKKEVSIPLTLLGGARSYEDLKDLVSACGIVGAAAGSLFVFKGVYKAVLISYPDFKVRDSIAKLVEC